MDVWKDGETAYVLATIRKSSGAYYSDPDGTRAYLSDLYLLKVTGDALSRTLLGSVAPNGETSFSTGALRVEGTAIYAFSNSKLQSGTYAMSGYLFTIDKATLALTKTQTLFSSANAGWWPVINAGPNVSHFGFAGYYRYNNTTNLGSVQPSVMAGEWASEHSSHSGNLVLQGEVSDLNGISRTTVVERLTQSVAVEAIGSPINDYFADTDLELAQKLFQSAEKSFPQYFPQPIAEALLPDDGMYVRYYSATDIALILFNGKVLLAGSVASGNPTFSEAGDILFFLDQLKAQPRAASSGSNCVTDKAGTKICAGDILDTLWGIPAKSRGSVSAINTNFQCVDFAKAFLLKVYGKTARSVAGKASNLCSPTIYQPYGLEVVAAPIEGDIYVRKPSGAKFCGSTGTEDCGHVAVVKSASASTYSTIQQNVSATSSDKDWTRQADDCVLRPREFFYENETSQVNLQRFTGRSVKKGEQFRFEWRIRATGLNYLPTTKLYLKFMSGTNILGSSLVEVSNLKYAPYSPDFSASTYIKSEFQESDFTVRNGHYVGPMTDIAKQLNSKSGDVYRTLIVGVTPTVASSLKSGTYSGKYILATGPNEADELAAKDGSNGVLVLKVAVTN